MRRRFENDGKIRRHDNRVKRIQTAIQEAQYTEIKRTSNDARDTVNNPRVSNGKGMSTVVGLATKLRRCWREPICYHCMADLTAQTNDDLCRWAICPSIARLMTTIQRPGTEASSGMEDGVHIHSS